MQPCTLNIAPGTIWPQGTVMGAGYYVMKQLFPPDAATRSCTGHLLLCANGSGSVFGLQRRHWVSVCATRSAPYGGCATLTAGPGRCMVEAAGPSGLQHLQKELVGMGPPASWSTPVAVRRDIPLRGGSVGNLVFAEPVLRGCDAAEYICLTLGFPPARYLADNGAEATAGTESLALAVAMAVKRLHLCLLCVATAFPAAAGGPLLAGI